jgi:4-diphosphocytidyl-2-C-methyl-D-erythritol kinase
MVDRMTTVLSLLFLEELPSGGLLLRPAAKINLNLLVGLRRADGFHEVDSYVSKVTLYDELLLRPRADGQITFTCTGYDCGNNEVNLALLAARLLAEGRHASGADITLAKRIPPGKGLGGGSSDAAAVLAGLNKLWQLGLPASELAQLAARLGSDVPMFLVPPSVRIRGRGEIISPLVVHPFWAVLHMGPFSCRTSDVYSAFDRHKTVMGRQVDPSVLTEPPTRWRGLLENQLLEAAIDVTPAIGETLSRLKASLPASVCMTGSGSALFSLFDDLPAASAALEALPEDLRKNCAIVSQNPW